MEKGPIKQSLNAAQPLPGKMGRKTNTGGQGVLRFYPFPFFLWLVSIQTMLMFLQIKQSPKGWYLKATWKKITHLIPQLTSKMSVFATP
jgi:hypothetical protein